MIEDRSEEHTSELQSPCNLVCRLLLEKNKLRAQHRRYAVLPYGTMGLARDALRRATRRPSPRRSARPLCLPGPRAPNLFFFFNDTATTEIYTLSLHDALPI